MSFDFDDFELRGRFYDLDEKTERLTTALKRLDEDARADFDEMCDIAYIYHDSALDGLVVTYQELRAVCDRNVATSSTLIPLYQTIKNHRDALRLVWDSKSWADGGSRRLASQGVLSVEDIVDTHVRLFSDLPRKVPGALRTEMPLHRTYFHQFSDPSHIETELAGIAGMTDDPEFRGQHPINQAVLFHDAFMRTYPFAFGSGQVGRLLMNGFLIRAGYFPAVIHGSDRQRYYDALKRGPEALRLLLLDSMESGLDAAKKFLAERQGMPARRSSVRVHA